MKIIVSLLALGFSTQSLAQLPPPPLAVMWAHDDINDEHLPNMAWPNYAVTFDQIEGSEEHIKLRASSVHDHGGVPVIQDVPPYAVTTSIGLEYASQADMSDQDYATLVPNLPVTYPNHTPYTGTTEFESSVEGDEDTIYIRWVVAYHAIPQGLARSGIESVSQPSLTDATINELICDDDEEKVGIHMYLENDGTAASKVRIEFHDGSDWDTLDTIDLDDDEFQSKDAVISQGAVYDRPEYYIQGQVKLRLVLTDSSGGDIELGDPVVAVCSGGSTGN